jgi:pimeloyl-ACP methyl ester carboxylesterase
MHRRFVVLAMGVVIGVVAACGGAASSAPVVPAASPALATSSAPVAPSSSPALSAAASADAGIIAGLFDIGGGRTLNLFCKGTGSPTILLEAGDESPLSEWHLVMPALARETRTCAYDRAGVGKSVAATGCRELGDLLGDLEALLTVAKIDGPYLLVGTSGGGFLMAGLAARHPADVRGLVLVETPKAITIMSPQLKADIACDAPNNVERRDYATVEHAAWDPRKKLGDFPMTIISNDYGAAAPPNDDAQTNVPDQRGWLVLSPNSKQVVVTTGHNVPEDQPDLVIREILAVLEVARRS